MAAASNGSEFFEFEIETGNESFSRPSNADSVAEDEELLLWAAIARLPSQRRTNFAIVRRTASESDGGQEKAETIDVTKLDRIGRELVVKKALATNEQDNYKLLSGVKKRLDRVGLQLPKVEVRFENLRITANVKTGKRALPTLVNFFRDKVEQTLTTLKIFRPKRHSLTVLDNVSGFLKPGRALFIWEPKQKYVIDQPKDERKIVHCGRAEMKLNQKFGVESDDESDNDMIKHNGKRSKSQKPGSKLTRSNHKVKR